MCGIFALLNNVNLTKQFIIEQFEKGKHRGPEFSIFKSVMIKADFGFHRLAINGLNDKSNQPIIINDIALICNGEIYNYKELYGIMDVKPNTDSDCEVIIHLYKKYGIEHTLQMLDGVFSFLLVDYRLENTNAKMYVARDPYGVRPLYMLFDENPHISDSVTGVDNVYGFASELKELTEIKDKLNGKNDKTKYDVIQFIPGTYSEYALNFKVNTEWKLIRQNCTYHRTGFHTNIISSGEDEITEMENSLKMVQNYLQEAVYKRCSTTERQVACLLSGGLDSSLITALVNDYNNKYGLPKLETYSIGLEGSEDLKYARLVADYLETTHTEIILSEQDFLNAIPHVIKDIESYDTTTVRASIGNWLLGKYISEHSDAKVIFNGDGSDELTAGYLYMKYSPDWIESDKECRRLLGDIYMYDVLRSDKSISSHGLEPRTPFLDRTWVQQYLSLPLHIRYQHKNGFIEKQLLRTAFSPSYFKNTQGKSLLPNEILWRKKEAFSDGVSKKTRSLYEIIQEFTKQQMGIDEENGGPEYYAELCKTDGTMSEVGDHLVPETSEQYYYRQIFETHYKGMGKIVPYFWMPKYVDAKDASARTLAIYNKD